MTESKEKSNFWTTIPGILTGLTGVVTAIGTVPAIVAGLAGVITAIGTGTIHVGTNGISTTWTCYNQGNPVGIVSIWWGHTAEDAKWACDEWRKPICGNEGGCSVTPK